MLNIARMPGPGDFAPPEVDEADEGLLSDQPLGDATVMVEFNLGLGALPIIVGAWLAGEFVEADEFSEPRLSQWREAISREIASDLIDAQDSDYAQSIIDSPEFRA
jgi:hypothetical protein